MPIISAKCRCDRCAVEEDGKEGAIYPEGWEALYLQAFQNDIPGQAQRLLCRQCLSALVGWVTELS
jgi:hypothetical protein